MMLLKPLSARTAWAVHWMLDREMRFLTITFLPPVAFGLTSAIAASCGWATVRDVTAPLIMGWVLMVGFAVLIVRRPRRAC